MNFYILYLITSELSMDDCAGGVNLLREFSRLLSRHKRQPETYFIAIVLRIHIPIGCSNKVEFAVRSCKNGKINFLVGKYVLLGV